MKIRLVCLVYAVFAFIYLIESIWLYFRHHIALYVVMLGIGIFQVFAAFIMIFRRKEGVKGDRRIL
jgi:hypothetical protein